MIIDKWVIKNENNLSNSSKVLFKEATLCFKIEAFKASLLFSYLGLFTVIKERIIVSKRPNSIAEARWNKIIKELNDEDTWEKRVFEELVNSSSGIFNITETIRQQVKFWKDRRNDCAHSKQNEISIHHVEMFWSFVRSNLSKITIEGGRQSLYNKFKEHFDETITPPNQNYSHLISEIEFAVEKNEWKDFFTDLFVIGDGQVKYFNVDRVINICENILVQIKDEEILEKLVLVIKSNTHNSLIDLILIADKPQFIHDLNYSKTEIRNIWKKRIWQQRRLSHSVFSTLLNNDFIPRNEIEDAVKTYYDNFDQSGFNNLPSDSVIKNSIFSKQLENNIFNDFFADDTNNLDDYDYINSKADLITLLVEKGDMNEKVVKGICEIYENNINPWWLTDSLQGLFKLNTIVRDEFLEKIQEYGLQVPKQLNL